MKSCLECGEGIEVGTRCLECIVSDRAVRRFARPVRSASVGESKCGDCGKVLPLDSFVIRRHRGGGATSKFCRPCRIAFVAAGGSRAVSTTVG